MSKKTDDFFDNGFLAVIVIVILLFVSYFFKKSERDKAIKKHEELVKKIDENEVTKAKLEKRFKRWYFFVRLSLIIIWLGFAWGYHYLFQINTIEDFLIYSEISLVALIAFNFLRFGSITNLSNYINAIKAATENRVYRKHLGLDDEIEEDKNKKSKVEETIKKLDCDIEAIEKIDLPFE